MNSSKLCPQCKTGQKTLNLDTQSFTCPYINCHDGHSCSKFEKLDKSHGTGLWSKILKNYKKSGCK